jgi:hypothetical protein
MDLKDGCNETTACNEATEDWTWSRNDAVHRGASRNKPQWCQSENQGSDVGSGIWPWSAARKWRKGPGEKADPVGSWLMPAGRCPAVQKWHGKKRNLFRNVQTQRKCWPQKELVLARREMTHCAKVAWRKGNIVRNKWTRAKAEWGIQKVQMYHEGREWRT